MSRPLVSVLTGTWQRHELLAEAIENIRGQTYRPLEHVIVSDGPDEHLDDWLADNGYDQQVCPHDQQLGDRSMSLRYVPLGRNWTSFLTNSRNAAPMIVAQLVARGDYLTWLADDERMTTDHIESLVDALEAAAADFAYSQTSMFRVGRPAERWTIGSDPPRCGEITNVLYRAALIETGLTRLGAGRIPDWDQIGAWVAAGASWAYLPRVTFEHRVDL